MAEKTITEVKTGMGEITVKEEVSINKDVVLETNSWICPAGLAKPFMIKALLPLVDLQNKDLILKVKSFVSDDGGQTWIRSNGAAFAGGPSVTKLGELSTYFGFTIPPEDVKGKQVKVTVKANTRINVAVSIKTDD